MVPGTISKFGVWHPHVRTWGLLEANVQYWRNYLWHCWAFSAPHVVIMRGWNSSFPPFIAPLPHAFINCKAASPPCPQLKHKLGMLQNPSRSSKVSKDSDCSLVSSKNFSEILPPNGWHPGPGKVGQGGLKVLHIWRHSQKRPAHPKQKNFFRVQTRRLDASFHASTRSVTRIEPEIFPCKATCV